MKDLLTNLSRALEALSAACLDNSEEGIQKLERAVDQLTYCAKILTEAPKEEATNLNIELQNIQKKLSLLLPKIGTEKENIRQEAKNLITRIQAQKSYIQGASHK